MDKQASSTGAATAPTNWVVVAPPRGVWAKCHGLFASHDAAIAWAKANQFDADNRDVHPVNRVCDCWRYARQVCDICHGPSGLDKPLSSAVPASSWRAISSAPKDADVLLLYLDGSGVQPGYWDKDRWLACETQGLTGGGWHTEPTHWMPLPDPPVSLGVGKQTKDDDYAR